MFTKRAGAEGKLVMRQMKGLPLLNETISMTHLTPFPLSHTPYLHLILSGKVEVLTSVVSKNNKDDNFTGAFGILYFLFTLVSLSATCSQTQFNTNIIINLKNIFLDLSHRPPRFGRLFSFRWRPFRSGYHNKNYRMNFILLSITLR